MTFHPTSDVTLHKTIEKEIAGLHFPRADIAREVHRKIRAADKHGEISTINRTFYASLDAVRVTKTISPKQLALLDKASCYTWLAYSLYDDILDNNTVAALPYANEFSRTACLLYEEAGIPHSLIARLFQSVDSANALEYSMRSKVREGYDATAAHLSVYEMLLSEKSIAHCLGQFWIASQQRTADTSALMKGFQHYCAARQLSDDIFDWRDDFQRQQPTFTTISLVQLAPQRSIRPSSSASLDILNRVFWEKGLEQLCTHVITYVAASKTHLSPLVDTQSTYFQCFIQPLADAATESIHSHKQTRQQFNAP